MTNNNDKPTVRAQRRRPSGSSSSGQRRRAAAPQRRTGSQDGQRNLGQTPSQPSYRPTSSSGTGGVGGGGGGALLGGLLSSLLRSKVGRIVLLVAVLGCGAIFLLSRCGSGLGGLGGLLGQDPAVSQQQPAPQQQPGGLPTVTPAFGPTSTPRPAVPPPAPGEQASWLVMLYQDADDKILEKDIYLDLNEAEIVGSTPGVHVVAQLDRYAGGFDGDGDWTGTRRYYLTPDNDLNRINSAIVGDLGEVNMSDGATLADFVIWAIETYPADKYALIMSDHGMGWPGGWSDPAPATASDRRTPLSASAGNQMYLDEIDAALHTIRTRAGIDRLELIGLDACLMAQLEVYSMLAQHGRYAVASEETEPGLGWAYTGFLQALSADPGMDGAALGRAIVDTYISDDQRIVDDAQRADLMRQGSPLGGLFGLAAAAPPSSAQVANQIGQNVTLSAVDLDKIPALMNAVNDLSLTLQGADQRALAKARSHALAFTNVFSQELPSPYLDLGHLMQMFQQTNGGAALNDATNRVMQALQESLVAEKHGQGKQGATGMAIYYPNATFYRTPATGPASFNVIASQFSRTSLWDDLLAFHYTGRNFDANALQSALPTELGTVTGPGLGAFSLGPVQADDTTAAPGDPVLLSTEISGQNLGYVYLFAGYYDRTANSLYVADMDYLESSDTRQVDGVYYPVWPEVAFALEFEWEPLVYYLSDGVNSVPALLNPETYGASGEQAVYTVDGVYAKTSGETVRARLYLQNGRLRQVFGFVGEGAASAPREIYPEEGDQFTVYERWLDMDAEGRVVQQSSQEGGTLVFGPDPIVWEELDAAPGSYIVGFMAQDLEGNRQQTYTEVTVQ